MKISKTKLCELIAETVFKNMQLNSSIFGDDLVKESLPLQIAVQSTMSILQDLGLFEIVED